MDAIRAALAGHDVRLRDERQPSPAGPRAGHTTRRHFRVGSDTVAAQIIGTPLLVTPNAPGWLHDSPERTTVPPTGDVAGLLAAVVVLVLVVEVAAVEVVLVDVVLVAVVLV